MKFRKPVDDCSHFVAECRSVREIMLYLWIQIGFGPETPFPVVKLIVSGS
jgi:hypothetical protein